MPEKICTKDQERGFFNDHDFLAEQSVAIAALERVLKDLEPARTSLDIALKVLEEEGLSRWDRLVLADCWLNEVKSMVLKEITSLKEYWASGEPERLAALDAEVATQKRSLRRDNGVGGV